MAEQFFKLSATDQKEIIHSLSPQIGLTPQVIEKDIWVCWVLDKLFSMPNALPMAFKGGTDVIKYKKIFFSTSYAQYDLCLQGKFKFFPDKANIMSLRSDYNQMIQAGMFSQEPLSFEKIIILLERLQTDINENLNVEKKISLLESI